MISKQIVICFVSLGLLTGCGASLEGDATQPTPTVIPVSAAALPTATPAPTPTPIPPPPAPGSPTPVRLLASPTPILSPTPTAGSPASAARPAEPAVSAPTPSAPATLAGTWAFNLGTMALSQQNQRVEGTYQWYGGADSGEVQGIIVDELNQFQGLWVSERDSNSQGFLNWQLAADRSSFSGTSERGTITSLWCGVPTGQPLPDGCGFSGAWQLRFGNPPGVTGQAMLVQIGGTVQGTFVDSAGQTGEMSGVLTVTSLTEARLTGTWRDSRGGQDSFDWRLDLTTGRTFQGRRNPGNSDWCGWRPGNDEPEPCGWVE